jgi:hypothetical protein
MRICGWLIGLTGNVPCIINGRNPDTPLQRHFGRRCWTTARSLCMLCCLLVFIPALPFTRRRKFFRVYFPWYVSISTNFSIRGWAFVSREFMSSGTPRSQDHGDDCQYLCRAFQRVLYIWEWSLIYLLVRRMTYHAPYATY